jgi:hypothetical protein
MGALNIQEACAWKEALEYVIDQVIMIAPLLAIHSSKT